MLSPLFSAALENRLTACLFHCNYTYADLLFIQVGSDPTPMHCSTGDGRMHSALLSAALQNRHKAGNDTCGHLLFMQVCSDPTPTPCNTVLGTDNMLLDAVLLWISCTQHICVRRATAVLFTPDSICWKSRSNNQFCPLCKRASQSFQQVRLQEA